MNLIFFIRLILKNAFLIGGVAIFMAILVFFMMGNKPETYSSEMVIYTGLATGYDIESGSDTRYDHFATNAKFDNLINIIRSRQTQEETAIRLMTQHLMLEKPDTRFCLNETWDAIREEVPREVMSLIHFPDDIINDEGYDLPGRVISDLDNERSSEPENQVESDDMISVPQTKWVTKTVMQTQMVVEQIRKVRSQPKYYKVKAGDYPVNIAKRFGLSFEQLKALNDPDDFPIYGGQTILVGKGENEYYVDTLVEVEVPVDTLVEELVPQIPDDEFYRPQVNPVKQMDSVSQNFDDIYDEALSHIQDYERSVANLIRYKNKDESNYIYTTLQSSNDIYGVEKISKIRASRVQNSDLLRLTYESHDQGVCQQTLKIITEVSKKQFQSIKGAQTSMVSDYFRRQRDAAKVRLDSLEDLNMRFRMDNRIINYDEQTKFIAEQNELMDRDWYEESATLSAAKAALYSLESEMDEYSKNLIQRSELMDLRGELSRLTRLISMEEIRVDPDIETMANYRLEKEKIQQQMDGYMNAAFQSKRTTAGIDMQSVLIKWLDMVVAVEESRAKYDVKSLQKREFMGKYDRFAPLGSTLTKIERGIDLAEQEYLIQTHSLDLSLMKQKNIEQSNIRTLDEPYFPIKPNPSKRMLAVIAAFMAGLFLTSGAIILLEFLDTSIKLPERVEELTKNKLIGAYPKIPVRIDSKIDYPLITARLIDMISQKIKLSELNRSATDKPFLIMMISTRPREGKTFLTSQMVDKFRAVGHRVLYIKPFEQKQKEEFDEQFRKYSEENQSWDFEYEIPDNFMSISSINELLRNYSFITRGYHYIFVELPALLSSDYPTALATEADLSLLVCRATRTWNRADDEVLDVYKTNSKQTVYSMLNGVHVNNLEGIIGEIPQKRSLIRKLIKKVINFDFKIARSF